MSGLDPAIESLALAPLSVVYGAAVGLRNRLFDRGALKSERLGVPVVSVGNLTVGGTGKTPLVEVISAHLASRGLSVAILTRGYGGAHTGPPLVLSEGGAAAAKEASLRAGAALAGDEPVLLARHLPGVAVVVGADRRRSGRIARERLGAEAIVLDDGFQHRRVARDLDIVVLDCFDPFGRYRLLPAGRLREPISSIRRADVVVVTRSDPRDALQTLEEVVRRFNPRALLVRAFHRPVGFLPITEGAPASAMAGEIIPVATMTRARALAFCGIGNPLAFRSDLAALGIELTAFQTFRDHHPYSRAEIARLARAATDSGASCLITTEKDAVRLEEGAAGSGREALPLYALRIRCEVQPEREFFAAIDAAVPGTRIPAAAEGEKRGADGGGA